MIDSEACAEKLAEAGINWVTTHCYKGFGLETEAEEIAATRTMIANYHRHNVQVFTYLQYGTVMPETMQLESEAARNWGRVDWNGQHDGHPYEYGDQYWRAKPCANQPGFREYMLRTVETAIEIGADGIWIDNLQADGCHCPHCQQAFQAYLQAHINDPCYELGLLDMALITIPRAERPRDPVYQAWVRFRCEETRTSLRLLAAHACVLKPDVLVAVNVGIGSQQRSLLDNGNWFTNLDCVDYTYAENGFFPGRNNGAMVSQHWPMGIGESIGIRIVPGAGCPYERVPNMLHLRRTFAESAMLGGHAFGGPYGLRGEDGGATPMLLRDAEYRKNSRQLVDWYAAHQTLFAGSVNAAPVALYYSQEAMIGDEARSRQAFEAMVQMLQQQQIPFRYVLSDRLAELDGLDLLILPHVLPLSDAQIEQLRTYVGSGGKLLATGRTSLYDARMRQRRDYALAAEFGVSFNAKIDGATDVLLLNPANGCIFLPGDWALPAPGVTNEALISPDRLARAIRNALPAMPEVLSPVPQVGVTWRQLPDGRHLLGLLNYGETPVSGILLQGEGATPELHFYNLEHDGSALEVILSPKGHWQVKLPTLAAEGFVMVGSVDN